MERLRLDASGLTFDAVADGPPDGRLALLLHGFPQSSREWSRLMPALAAHGFRAVAPDQRGYSAGARPRSVEAYAMSELVGDVTGMLDAAGADRADLVGHDWGAAVAWQTAIRHPARVRSLSAISVPHPLAFSEAIANDPDQRERASYMLFFGRGDGSAERVLSEDGWRRLRAIYEDKVAQDDVDHYVELLSTDGALTAALNWYGAASRRDLEGAGPVPVPTLYVWSTEDRAIGRRAAEATAAHVTGPYRFVELDGVTHWIPDEAPERLAAEVLDHLAGS